MKCENCAHQPVCDRFKATGGVKSCEHHLEERHGRWVPMFNAKSLDHWVECSKCHTVGSPFWKRCPVCEAKMRGSQ